MAERLWCAWSGRARHRVAIAASASQTLSGGFGNVLACEAGCDLHFEADRTANGALSVTYLVLDTHACASGDVKPITLVADATAGDTLSATVEGDMLGCAPSANDDLACAAGKLTLRLDGPVLGGKHETINPGEVTFKDPVEFELALCATPNAALACP